MKLVIVESPSKAKTINKYLGNDYYVTASYGHIRQLPSKSGSVDPKDKFNMIWEETPQAKKNLKLLISKVKSDPPETIYLATDPDREGEAISWHLANYLKENKSIKIKSKFERVVFNSITKSAVTEAFKHTRAIDDKLVSSYLTRLALDYLVGFNISPILWHKLPGSKSAGRVQSVSLRLIAERENEIEEFKSIEYWQVFTLLTNNKNQELQASLTVFKSKKLGKLDIKTKEESELIKQSLVKEPYYTLKDINKKSLNRNPYAPYTTSTLQQDAFNKLGFSAKKTMLVAQKLYEGFKINGETTGLITYMRTDATQINPEFILNIREYIKSNFGEKYLPKNSRIYKTKSKNAQEAHEAIRPVNVTFIPKNVDSFLTIDEYKLYKLIWERTVASQMESAKYNNITYEITNNTETTVLKAGNSVLVFDGFYKVYEKRDKSNSDNQFPILELNSKLSCKSVDITQHFTEPPPRYTEASLVKSLEELGIGRPSTYANIISVLIARQYARIESKKFYVEDRGRILNVFLTHFFTKYVDYSFTADLEDKLDAISNGKLTSLEVLTSFWADFSNTVKETKNVHPLEVIEAINSQLANKFIGEDKACPSCKDGSLLIKNSKFGAFIGCSKYPDCKYNRKLHVNGEQGDSDQPLMSISDKIILLENDEMTISVKQGPYGFYVEKEVVGSKKPIRSTIPANLQADKIDLKTASFLLELPKNIADDIYLGIGRFGPYLKKDNSYFSYKGDIFTLTKDQALECIQIQLMKKHGVLLGNHPKSRKEIYVKFSRFGPYIEYNNNKIKIPKDSKDIFKDMHNSDEMLGFAIKAIKDGNL